MLTNKFFIAAVLIALLLWVVYYKSVEALTAIEDYTKPLRTK